jgi:hypothetical protein
VVFGAAAPVFGDVAAFGVAAFFVVGVVFLVAIFILSIHCHYAASQGVQGSTLLTRAIYTSCPIDSSLLHASIRQ